MSHSTPTSQSQTLASGPRPKKQKKSRKSRSILPKRERNFDLSFSKHHLPEYQPLKDVHSMQFFSNPKIQHQLMKNGIMDANGRLVPQGRVEAALRSIDRELERAEKATEEARKDQEFRRRKEEAKARREEERERVRLRTQAARQRVVFPQISSKFNTES
ncbi:hypothetical protein GEMRC1_004355 [Eukaryota sp. GEM-RC1]